MIEQEHAKLTEQLKEQLIQSGAREEDNQRELILLQENLVAMSQEKSSLRIKAIADQAAISSLEKEYEYVSAPKLQSAEDQRQHKKKVTMIRQR